MQLKDESPHSEIEAPTFGALLDRYIKHELPERYSTRKSHLSNIRKRIRPRSSEYPVEKKPMTMEQRVRELEPVLRRLDAAVEKERAPEIIGVFDPC
jgi:integrase